MNKVLVTGGAGYIGSFIIRLLLDRGDEVIVVDNFSRGQRYAVDNLPIHVEELDILDRAGLNRFFRRIEPDVVIHLAGLADARESGEDVARSNWYFDTNCIGTMNVLRAMKESATRVLIASSSCAIYGNADNPPLTERSALNPLSPYARSKLAMEQAVYAATWRYDYNFMLLRYFNAAGAQVGGTLGERWSTTRLISKALIAAYTGEEFYLFGDDFSTPDGTAVRDYTHVRDIAAAHMSAMNLLSIDGGQYTLNIGTGRGYSIREVLSMIEQVTKKRINLVVKQKILGEPATVYADVSLANDVLQWEAKYSLEEIVRSTWLWLKYSQNKGLIQL